MIERDVRAHTGLALCPDATQIWRTDGFMGFWRGIMPCLMRAFPANGAGFLAYEASWKVLKMVAGE